MAFLEVIPKGKFGAKVKTAAVDLLKKYKLSTLPDPTSLGKHLTNASPDLSARIGEFDSLFKQIQPIPPQLALNWEKPNWEAIASQFGIFSTNPSQEQLAKARTNLLEKFELKKSRSVAKAEAVHAHADPAAAAANLNKYLNNIPKEVSGSIRTTIEGLVKSVLSRVKSTTQSGDKDAILSQYKTLQAEIAEIEKEKTATVSDNKAVEKQARSLFHPINEYLVPLKESSNIIQNRPVPQAQVVWDQSQLIFEAMEVEWTLRTLHARDQLNHYKKELELVDLMQEELDDTQADHLLILKPHLVDEILAKFYDMKIGEEEQENHLPSGFDSLQEIEDAANVFLKENKQFNDAEVLTSHLLEEETNAMLAAGEHH